MTLSARSDAEACPSCGGATAWRPLHPFPVLVQLLFGASFVLFLFFLDQMQSRRVYVWLWTVVQVVLGGFLIYGRYRAKLRVLRCIRCGQDLR